MKNGGSWDLPAAADAPLTEEKTSLHEVDYSIASGDWKDDGGERLNDSGGLSRSGRDAHFTLLGFHFGHAPNHPPQHHPQIGTPPPIIIIIILNRHTNASLSSPTKQTWASRASMTEHSPPSLFRRNCPYWSSHRLNTETEEELADAKSRSSQSSTR
ncbi:hypothetical protein PIB30_014825 [Stylosanthes scabra]|uniref:Uncharacterized protein n=1 Tax=Stylosanthes scabra TaxID=79078 RepID=A0ABU6R743_9FABA|nr:hypothetical protein [Stylosanthes scabra]